MTKGSLLPLMLIVISALSNNNIAASPLLDLEIDENNPLLSRNLSSGGRRHRLFKEGKFERGTRTKDEVVVTADVKKDKLDLAAAAIAAYKRTEGIDSDKHVQHGGTNGINSDSGQSDQSGSSKDDGQHFSNDNIDDKGKIELESKYELPEKVSPSPLEEGGVTTTEEVVIRSRLEDGQTAVTAEDSASNNEEKTTQHAQEEEVDDGASEKNEELEESEEIENLVEKERKNDAGSSIGFGRDGHDNSPDHDGDEDSSTTAHDDEGEEDHDDHDSLEEDYEHTEDHDDEDEDGELDCEEVEPILHRGLRHAHKGHHSTTKGGKSAKHSKSTSGKSSKTAIVVSAKSVKSVPSGSVHVQKHEHDHEHEQQHNHKYVGHPHHNHDAKSGKSSKNATVANIVNNIPSAKSGKLAKAKSAKSTTIYHPPVAVVASAKSVKTTTVPVVAKSVKSAKSVKNAKAKKPKGAKSAKSQVKCTPKPTAKPTEGSMPNITSAPVSDDGGTSTPNPTESPIDGGEVTGSPTSDTDLSDAPTTESPTKLATSPPSLSPVGTQPTSETPTKAPTLNPTPESTLPPVTATTSSPTNPPTAALTSSPTKLTASPIVSTASPTLKPVDVMSLPTKSPEDGTSSPTASPVDDTASPTNATIITSSPTPPPTASPIAATVSPTLKPVDAMSLPTKSPVDGTSSPTPSIVDDTASPTNATIITSSPTTPPTASPVVSTASPTDVSTSTSSPTNPSTASPGDDTPPPTLKPVDSINTSQTTVTTNPTIGSGTPQPTDGSAGSPAPSSAAPTSIPDRAFYYSGFEQGFNLALDPWWMSEGNAPWERTNEEAASGVFSIRSPDLSNEELTPGESNVTLTTDPSWDSGALHFSAFSAVNEPFDRLTIFVDGEPRGDGGFTENPDGFEEGTLNLGPGEHQITFRYQYNPNELDIFPPQGAGRIGAVFLDAIYFVPAAITAPTQAAVPTTIAPTSTPDDAIYYDGFEQGTFPESDDEWSTKGELPWELTTQEVNSGVFSIRSPQLTSGIRTGESNVTFSTNPAWGIGTLHYSVYSAVRAPHDDFRIFVDDIQRIAGPNTVNTTGFEEQELQLPPGTKEVTFAYRWNPFDLDSLPPAQPGRIDAVFLDDVYFAPSSGNVLVPASVPTSGGTGNDLIPTCVPLSPNPDDFEDGTFPSSPWSISGIGDWGLATDKAFTGNTSIKSPSFDGTSATSSNVTLTLCDDFPGGLLSAQVIASVQPPHDVLFVFVDGENVAQMAGTHDWIRWELQLEPGPHRVDFNYQYGSFEVDPLPPSPPLRQGAVWIDAVEIETIQT